MDLPEGAKPWDNIAEHFIACVLDGVECLAPLHHGLVVQEMMEAYRARVDQGVSVVDELLAKEDANYPYAVNWEPYLQQACTAFLQTAVPMERIRALWRKLEQLPDGFELNRNVAKIMDNRRKMAAGAMPIDWGFAETTAYASLV